MVICTHLFALKLSIVGAAVPYVKNSAPINSTVPLKIKAKKAEPCHHSEKKELEEHHHNEEEIDEERKRKELEKKKMLIRRSRRVNRVVRLSPYGSLRKRRHATHRRSHTPRYAHGGQT